MNTEAILKGNALHDITHWGIRAALGTIFIVHSLKKFDPSWQEWLISIGIVGACVYAACREMDVTRTIVDISNNLHGNRNSLAKDYRMLFQNLKLNVSIPDPIRCIIKIANNLNISENTKREAMRIFDTLKEKKLIAGKKPNSVAATVIYMAGIKTGVNLSQQKISKVSGITGVTLRNRYKEYKKHVL